VGENTSIGWTHHTFNPWWGCTKVSPGCKHCYAESLAKRYGHDVWGVKPRWFLSEANWGKPVRWNREAAELGIRYRVFCGSQCDVLEQLEGPAGARLDLERQRLFALIRATPHLDWLLLTKRPENAHLIPADVMAMIWFGTTTEDQEHADKRVALLLQCNPRIRFVSAEPLLGAIDFMNLRGAEWFNARAPATFHSMPVTYDALHGIANYHRTPSSSGGFFGPRIDWVIVGGESGPKARGSDVEAIHSIVMQCRVARVPVFVKQLGRHPLLGVYPLRVKSPKGEDLADIPEALRIRDIPTPRAA
jgi:protein gp37